MRLIMFLLACVFHYSSYPCLWLAKLTYWIFFGLANFFSDLASKCLKKA